jgi:hypothetical protein
MTKQEPRVPVKKRRVGWRRTKGRGMEKKGRDIWKDGSQTGTQGK